MSSYDDSGERTEKPTEKRRRESREKGQVARSQEVNSFLIMMAGTLVILAFHSYILNGIERVFHNAFRIPPSMVEPGNIVNLASRTAGWFFPLVMPFFIAAIVAGLVANVGQVGFHIVSDSLTPKWEKINPVEGLKKIFSWKSVFETVKGAAKIGVTGLIVYMTLQPSINRILSLPESGTGSIIGITVQSGLNIMFRVLIVMIVVAVADYAFQFWQNDKKMRMTLREVRDELKDTEGDPQIKQRIRNIQREMAARRMMDDVKAASVVLTNPTTLAVALKYGAELDAPRVVAMGKNKLAERIRETARENRVPVIENKPLAWALYKSCEIGAAVPVHLYKAVAEILAYVYSLKGRSPA